MSSNSLEREIRIFIQVLNSWFGYPAIAYSLVGIIAIQIVWFTHMDRMSDHFNSLYFEKPNTFDFIIVGAGSSGNPLAKELVEKDFSVLLLEAGGETFPLTLVPSFAVAFLNKKYVDWQFQTTPQNRSCLSMIDRKCNHPRGIGLGGSSNLNWMMYARGSKHDYNQWAEITGDNRWSYENILPYFKKIENYQNPIEWNEFNTKYHGRNGPIKVSYPQYTGMASDFVKAGKEMGYDEIDVNADYSQGFSTISYNHENGRRLNSYKAFIEPIRNHPKLTIFKFAFVHKVLVNSKMEAFGVEYKRHGQIKRVFAKNEIILSAGSYGTPKILMLSGIGPKFHLESLGIPVIKDLPVGLNLQDHITAPIGPFLVDKPITLNVDRDVNSQATLDYIRNGSGLLSSTGIQATAFLVTKYAKSRNETSWPDLQWICLGTAISRRAEPEIESAFNIIPGVLEDFYKSAKYKDSFQITTILSRPRSRGQVKLDGWDYESALALPPLINPNYYDDENDLHVMIEGLEKAVNFVENSPTFKSMGGRLNPRPYPPCRKEKFRSRAYYGCFASFFSFTLFHPSGTCQMGPENSPQSVINSKLQVIGIKGLRVADASIMPKIISANTNAVCMVIGTLAADLLIDDWTNQI